MRHWRGWFITHAIGAAAMGFIIIYSGAYKPPWLLQGIWALFGVAVGFDLNTTILRFKAARITASRKKQVIASDRRIE